MGEEKVAFSALSEKAQAKAKALKEEGKKAKAHKRAHWSVKAASDETISVHYKPVDFDA